MTPGASSPRPPMKCPKCQYISFDSGDRCRNCGYEFSLAAEAARRTAAGSADPERQRTDWAPRRIFRCTRRTFRCSNRKRERSRRTAGRTAPHRVRRSRSAVPHRSRRVRNRRSESPAASRSVDLEAAAGSRHRRPCGFLLRAGRTRAARGQVDPGGAATQPWPPPLRLRVCSAGLIDFVLIGTIDVRRRLLHAADLRPDVRARSRRCRWRRSLSFLAAAQRRLPLDVRRRRRPDDRQDGGGHPRDSGRSGRDRCVRARDVRPGRGPRRRLPRVRPAGWGSDSSRRSSAGSAARCTIASPTPASSKRDSPRRLPRDRRLLRLLSRSRRAPSGPPRGSWSTCWYGGRSSPIVEVGADRGDIRRGHLGRDARRALLRRHRSRPGRHRRSPRECSSRSRSSPSAGPAALRASSSSACST